MVTDYMSGIRYIIFITTNKTENFYKSVNIFEITV